MATPRVAAGAGRVLLVRPTYKPWESKNSSHTGTSPAATSSRANHPRRRVLGKFARSWESSPCWARSLSSTGPRTPVKATRCCSSSMAASLPQTRRPASPPISRAVRVRLYRSGALRRGAHSATQQATPPGHRRPPPRSSHLCRARCLSLACHRLTAIGPCPSDLVTLFFPGSRAALGDASLRAPLRAVLGHRPASPSRPGLTCRERGRCGQTPSVCLVTPAAACGRAPGSSSPNRSGAFPLDRDRLGVTARQPTVDEPGGPVLNPPRARG